MMRKASNPCFGACLRKKSMEMHMVAAREKTAARDWLYQQSRVSAASSTEKRSLLRCVSKGRMPITITAQTAVRSP